MSSNVHNNNYGGSLSKMTVDVEVVTTGQFFSLSSVTTLLPQITVLNALRRLKFIVIKKDLSRHLD